MGVYLRHHDTDNLDPLGTDSVVYVCVCVCVWGGGGGGGVKGICGRQSLRGFRNT